MFNICVYVSIYLSMYLSAIYGSTCIHINAFKCLSSVSICLSIHNTHTEYIHLFYFIEVLVNWYKMMSASSLVFMWLKESFWEMGFYLFPPPAPNIDISPLSLFLKSQLTQIYWVRRLCWRWKRIETKGGLSWFFS